MTMTKEYNELAQKAKLDLVKEDRENARIREKAIKQQMARKYNESKSARVSGRRLSFEESGASKETQGEGQLH